VIVVFCDRPYVKDGPKARFYAGVPIITPSGINIGALCVLDDKPRDGLEPSQVEILRGMASTVFPGSFCNCRIVIHFSFGQESNRSVICNVFVSADGRPAKIDEGQAGHGWEISAFRFLKRHRNFRERLSAPSSRIPHATSRRLSHAPKTLSNILMVELYIMQPGDRAKKALRLPFYRISSHVPSEQYRAPASEPLCVTMRARRYPVTEF
jgi:hypothetical protein